MKSKKFRGLISTLLILSALVSLITGAILFFLKYGMWLVFTRNFLYNIHAVSGLIMAVAVMIHFFVNYRMYIMEIQEFFKQNK